MVVLGVMQLLYLRVLVFSYNVVFGNPLAVMHTLCCLVFLLGCYCCSACCLV